MHKAYPATKTETSATRHYILGTAGHIDHGKTSLIRALTGTDTDRLPEEKQRGMTIDLGFAELAVGNIRFGVVDVPGHERFVRTMVAGATGIDVALLVIAADDSVMPQTVEHVEILGLLGVSRSVVAITKIDTVDEEMLELVLDDVRRFLEPTALHASSICPVSSVTGAGLDELRAALATAVQDVKRTPDAPPFRMAVDRVFTVQGRGTVVTGSTLRGTVYANDTLEVWPGGETCRVRDLQSHGAHSEAIGRGRRCALNLSGIDREHLSRGCQLATPGYLEPSHLIDVRLTCLSSYGKSLKSSGVVRLESGTSEVPVRVVLVEGKALPPGASAYAQLRCGGPVFATYGQRFILRDENASRTIGGGTVLRPVARRRRLRDPQAETASLQALESTDEADRVEQVLRQAGFTPVTDLQMCARAGVELEAIPAIYARLACERRWIPVPGTDARVVPAALDDLKSRFVRWLERHHNKNPDSPGRQIDSVLGWLERITSRALARPLLDAWFEDGTVKRLGQFVCLPAFAPQLSAADEKLLTTLVAELQAGGFLPPLLDAAKAGASADRKRLERLATLATALGDLVHVGDSLYLHVDAEKGLREEVAALIERDGPATVAQIREALNSSRKYVVPFLEYLDRIGFTKRVGDTRVLANHSRE